jgi:CBS domain-containing protein
MNIGDILRYKDTRIATVRMEETVATAELLLQTTDIGALVVKDDCRTEGNVVVGMFSVSDLTRVLAIYGRSGAKLKIATLISMKLLVSCNSADSVEQVHQLMTTHNVNCVPVIDDHTLIGIVSLSEIGAARDLSDSRALSSI